MLSQRFAADKWTAKHRLYPAMTNMKVFTHIRMIVCAEVRNDILVYYNWGRNEMPLLPNSSELTTVVH